jgi:hypothetical protein
VIHLPDEVIARWPNGGTRPARGLLVGAVLVRATFADEMTQAPEGHRTSAANRWAVDCAFLSGIRFCDVASIRVALLLADEVSRFAEGDLESVRNGPELVRACGRVLGKWVEYLVVLDHELGMEATPLDYRAWCAHEGWPAPIPRACDMREWHDNDDDEQGVCDGT